MNEIALQKRGRGRPSGSTSFVKIKLQDLIDNLGKNASVVVSKKWMEEIGLTQDDSIPIVAASTIINEEEPKIQFTLTH